LERERGGEKTNASTESGSQIHFEVSFEIHEDGEQDIEFGDPDESVPILDMMEEEAGETASEDGEEEGG
jgi:hypothetical protein